MLRRGFSQPSSGGDHGSVWRTRACGPRDWPKTSHMSYILCPFSFVSKNSSLSMDIRLKFSVNKIHFHQENVMFLFTLSLSLTEKEKVNFDMSKPTHLTSYFYKTSDNCGSYKRVSGWRCLPCKLPVPVESHVPHMYVSLGLPTVIPELPHHLGCDPHPFCLPKTRLHHPPQDTLMP